MFLISSADGAASTMVPVEMISPRRSRRSNTMSAPVLVRDISAQAETVAVIMLSTSSGASAGTISRLKLPLPICSSRRRSSG